MSGHTRTRMRPMTEEECEVADGRRLYVIEARNPDGSLNFDAPQPEAIFGTLAITGIAEHRMARMIWSRVPDAVLDGASLCLWPRLIDPRFTARTKYW